MSVALNPRENRRFLHSLRVATGTALAGYDLQNRRLAAGGAQFLALAAKGVEAFQFPEAGLLSADGLLRARLVRDADGGATLTVQAQGAAGLHAYASKRAHLALGDGLTLESAFDRSGTLVLGLTPDEVAEADLSRFTLALSGA